jgi:hypothetical protein
MTNADAEASLFELVRREDAGSLRRALGNGADPHKTLGGQTPRQMVSGMLTRLSRFEYQDVPRLRKLCDMYMALMLAEL